MEKNQDYYTVKELADILGISRIAVFKKIQKRQIKAEKIGRNYIILKKDINLKNSISAKENKKPINKFIEKNMVARNLKKNYALLKKKYNVKKLGIFGSVARGDQRIGSDVDIVVEFNENPGLFTFIAMENDLSKIIGQKVDLVEKSAIKPIVKKSIIKDIFYV